MRGTIASVLVGCATLGLGCFSKPGFTGKEDAAIDASLDASLDASVDAPSCVFPNNVDFPNRNALAVGDISGDGLDDVALFGTEQGAAERQMIFVYFGGDRQIKFDCPDQTIVANSDILRVGLVKLERDVASGRTGVLSYVSQLNNNELRLTRIVYDKKVAGSTSSSEGPPAGGMTPSWDDSSIYEVYRAAFISDQRPANAEILFGGGGAVMSAKMNAGTPSQVASAVVMNDTELNSMLQRFPSYYGMVSIGAQRHFVVTGRKTHLVERMSTAAPFTLNDAPPVNGFGRLVEGDGDSEGGVYSFRDLSAKANSVVVGLRFSKFGNNPPPSMPTFLTIRNDKSALRCQFDISIANSFFTDGTVLAPFKESGTRFVGVFTTNPTSPGSTNRLVVSDNAWSANSCDQAAANGYKLYKLRSGVAADSSPIMVGGMFNPDQQQVLLFYREQPAIGQCFEVLASDPGRCLALCGELTCAP